MKFGFSLQNVGNTNCKKFCLVCQHTFVTGFLKLAPRGGAKDL
jgi:hypothetical protein